MKRRERGEDENGPPEGKRAAGLRGGESSETVANNRSAPAASGQRLTTDDALTYLKDVKEKFKDDKEKYNEFLEVMKDFKAQKVDTAGVITRVKDLFKGHRKLILGFNTFLPRGYEITLPPEEDKKQPAVEFDQAINYVNKIKARFQTDEQVYKAFLEILNMYRKGNKTINEVYQEVAGLFQDHSDLLEEFTYFLPGTNGSTAPTPHSNIKPVQQPPRQRDEKGVGGDVKCVIDRTIVVKKEKNSAMPGERSRDRDPERRAEKARKFGEKADKKDIGDRKERADREEGSRDIDKDFAELKPKRASARNASDAIRRQSQAGEGGEGFSGPAPQASTDDKRAVKAAAVQYPFFDKVKARLRSRDTYQEFLKCLNIFSQEIISRGELQNLVGDILEKHADLMEGFNEFLTHCENVEGYLAGVFSGRKLGDFAEGAPLKGPKAERDIERDRNREKDWEREKDREREREKEERDRERDVKERERDVKPAHGVKGEGSHKVTSHKDKFMNKPISELDLSNCERCTPSYRLLPKNYPKPVSSHRTPLGNSVLNDHWVSVTSGSEDYSFKHMRKNQYEESLFRCEDDRFELDMLLESTAVTAKLVGEYTQRQEGENGKAPPVEEFLSAINLRCIERIYGDHGLDILEVLRKNTSRAMPVIHSRLVQKEEEWTKCREDMNKVWSEVYAKNVYKALDHRSFYFRQQDKKALSTKGLLAEIKEVNEKTRREDDTMLAIAAGNRRPLVPDLRYEFGDASIHDDIYEIIKYSSEEISSSPDHMEKIMRMWRTFLEPMLGISLRAEGAEDMEVAAKAKGLEGKSMDGNAVESGAGSEGDETSSPEGCGFGSEGMCAVDRVVEGVGLDGPRAGETNGDAERAAVVGEGNGRDGSGAENAGAGEDEHGREVANEVRAMDMDAGAAEGTAARTEGSGWLQFENSGVRQSSMAGETEARSIGWQTEGRVSRSLVVGGNGSGGRGTVEREEGELSPTSEQEDRNKVKGSPRRGVEEDGTVKMLGQDVEDGEGVGGTEMDHDHDGDDEAEESVPKTSEDSDNASEAGEVSASEQSGDEQSEHEDAKDEDDQDGKAESEGEAEGMEDGDGDGNSSLDGSFAHCKPLAASSEEFVVGSNSKKTGKIFYGNDLFYVLFRLHQTLYERILSAKVNAELAAKKKCSDGGAAPNLYAKFMKVLYGLLDGSVDNSKFEDECRALIGTQSYVLFTLDKLIFKLVKQLQAAATDDVALKLLALNAYEKASEAVDLVYHANSCVLLHDECIYRFEHKSNPSELLIQLMDGGSVKHEVGGSALESSFQSYLDDFLLSVPLGKNNRVFMMRCKKRNYAGRDEDEALQGAMENAVIENGLENKISCYTFKVSYVLDTADLFLRCTARRARKHKEKRELIKQRAFGEWLDRRQRCLNDRSMGSEIALCAAALWGWGGGEGCHQETRRLCLLRFKPFGFILLKPQLVPILAERQVK